MCASATPKNNLTTRHCIALSKEVKLNNIFGLTSEVWAKVDHSRQLTAGEGALQRRCADDAEGGEDGVAARRGDAARQDALADGADAGGQLAHVAAAHGVAAEEAVAERPEGGGEGDAGHVGQGRHQADLRMEGHGRAAIRDSRLPA